MLFMICTSETLFSIRDSIILLNLFLSSAFSISRPFTTAVDTAFSSQYTVETSIELYQNICEKAEELEDPTISKNGLHHILEQCGATEDDLNAFDREFPDNVVLHSNSIIDTRKCTISAYGMTLKIDRDQLDLLETRNIDGQTYLCIPITNNFRVNDVEIKG